MGTHQNIAKNNDKMVTNIKQGVISAIPTKMKKECTEGNSTVERVYDIDHQVNR